MRASVGSNRPADLEIRLQSISERRREVALAFAKEARQAAADARQWNVQGNAKHVVNAIWRLGDCRAEPAVPFLEMVARKNHWPENSLEGILQLVLAIVRDCDGADAEQSLAPLVMRDAWNYVLQWRVAVWCYDANVSKGVACHTNIIIDEFKRRLQAVPVDVSFGLRASCTCLFRCVQERPAIFNPNHRRSVWRKWVERWRVRWGGRYGRLRARDHVEPEDMLAKARACDSYCAHIALRV